MEVGLIKSVYYHPAMDYAGAVMNIGLECCMLKGFGIAPSGAGCWGCDVLEMYSDVGVL
jgi:hypothetical protein